MVQQPVTGYRLFGREESHAHPHTCARSCAHRNLRLKFHSLLLFYILYRLWWFYFSKLLVQNSSAYLLRAALNYAIKLLWSKMFIPEHATKSFKREIKVCIGVFIYTHVQKHIYKVNLLLSFLIRSSAYGERIDTRKLCMRWAPLDQHHRHTCDDCKKICMKTEARWNKYDNDCDMMTDWQISSIIVYVCICCIIYKYEHSLRIHSMYISGTRPTCECDPSSVSHVHELDIMFFLYYFFFFFRSFTFFCTHWGTVLWPHSICVCI